MRIQISGNYSIELNREISKVFTERLNESEIKLFTILRKTANSISGEAPSRYNSNRYSLTCMWWLGSR